MTSTRLTQRLRLKKLTTNVVSRYIYIYSLLFIRKAITSNSRWLLIFSRGVRAFAIEIPNVSHLIYRVATKILHQTKDSWQSATKCFVSEALHPFRCIARFLGIAYSSSALRNSSYVAAQECCVSPYTLQPQGTSPLRDCEFLSAWIR